jgi:ComF family protein
MKGRPPAWLRLFFQGRCSLCDRPTPTELCRDCRHQILSCQLAPPHRQSGSPVLLSWGVYEGPLKRAIAALKYRHQPQIARPLGQWLAQTWTAQMPDYPLLVVPIPLHPAREQQRGYNQAELLAQSFCEYSGLSLGRQGLQRLRDTQAQFGLSAPERAQNVRQAFGLGRDFRRRSPTQAVLLLDDIYTTGATVASAIATLQQAQIPVYGCVTVARAKLLASKQPSSS